MPLSRERNSVRSLVCNRTMRDVALAFAHALESAQLELVDAVAYGCKVPSPAAEEATREALLAVKRARELLQITIKRIPE